jgi:cytochrome P450
VWDAIADGSVDCARVVDEVLRYRSAVTGVGRTVDRLVRVGDEPIDAGERVFLSLWAANHDAAVFPAPDAMEPDANAEVPHLAFGHGAHFCLGAALARAELQEALRALTDRLEPPRVLDGARWAPPLGITGPQSLPLGFAPRRPPAAHDDV